MTISVVEHLVHSLQCCFKIVKLLRGGVQLEEVSCQKTYLEFHSCFLHQPPFLLDSHSCEPVTLDRDLSCFCCHGFLDCEGLCSLKAGGKMCASLVKLFLLGILVQQQEKQIMQRKTIYFYVYMIQVAKLSASMNEDFKQ